MSLRTTLSAAVLGVLPNRHTLATMCRSPRRDLIAGVTVAIVALLLALGFGISSGMGAEAGLVAGALAAVFGGSNLRVSGPTAAMTVRIDGPLLFAAAHRFLLELTEVADVRVVILPLSRISVLNASGVKVLGDAIDRLGARGILVLVSGVRKDHLNRLDALGALDDLHAGGRILPSTAEAIGHARAHLAGAGLIPQLPPDGELVGASR